MALEDFNQRLYAAADALNIELDETRAAGLLGYLEQLQRWNKTYNLTALRTPEQMLVQHVVDSLSVLGPVSNILYKNTASNPRILDVGSGAGLPGVIMGIMRPEWQVSCVDAVEKKMAFIRQAAAVLRLANVQAIHHRVESLEPHEADVVISRAFASLVDFAQLAGRHVAVGGVLLAMKGREPQEEMQVLQQETEWRVSHVQPLLVPELDAQRCLVWMSRQGTL